jgi:uridine kinase
MKKPVLIGVAGGTGSGKTTFASAIMESVGAERTLLISQDAYYHDRALARVYVFVGQGQGRFFLLLMTDDR